MSELVEIKERFFRCRPPVDIRNLNGELLENDVQRYLELATALGVSAASPVKKEMLLMDPRTNLKCRIPPCPNYGTCALCPPYTYSFEESQKIVSKYHMGILFRWDFPRASALDVPSGTKRKQDIYKTLAKLEAAAFYDGYYFSCAFGGGTCKHAFCHDKECRALAEPHKGCRFPLLARSSMEGFGFDAYAMASQAGWPLYPAGIHCPDKIETLYRIGLLLIA